MNSMLVEYYEALRPAYDELLEWAERFQSGRPSIAQRLVDAATIIAIPALLVFLIPIVPYLATFGPDGGFGPIVVGSDEPLVFLAIWVGGAALLGCILGGLIWLERKVDPVLPPPPHRLSADQMSFVAAFEAADALRQYFVGFVESHLERAESAIERLIDRGATFPTLFPTHDDHALLMLEGRMVEVRNWGGASDDPVGASFLPRIYEIESALRLSERAPWVEVSGNSQRRMRAVVSIPDKVLPRIRQRTDLPRVREIIDSLATFLYGFLPDHEARMDAAKLAEARQEGSAALDGLTGLLESLSPIRDKARLSKRVPKASWVTNVIQNPNPLARLAAWVVILLALAALLAIVLDAIWGLTGDTLALVVIPTALLGAATLTVLQGTSPIRDLTRAPRDSEEDDEGASQP